MTVWMKLTFMIMILGTGFYFWRKPLSSVSRTIVAGLTLATCAILWLIPLAPNEPMKMYEEGDRAISQSEPGTKIPGPAGDNTAQAKSATQPAPGKTKSETAVAKPTPGDTDPAVPVSNPVATSGAVTEQGSIIAKVNDEQLDAWIGDGIPIKPKGSTMVNTVIKKGTIQAANRNSPSDEGYSFPEVVEGSNGMAMIIPDEPLPALSSRRQLTTADDDIPGPGDVVALTYDMFSWSTGEMVESSQTALNGPLVYRLGGENSPVGIPRFLDESIHDRPYGSIIQVVFEKEMIDLPGYMKSEDGYVLVVRIDRPATDGETAIEDMVKALKP